MRDDTASQASLRLGYVLSQDAYGAGLELSLNATDFPLPELAVGRLVETRQEILAVIAAYLGTADGTVATPKRGLVTGYDFLEDAALSVRDEFTAGMGAAGVVDSLIADQALSPLDPASWTADDLAALLLKNRYDLAFLAGHFSANSALAADYATSVLAATCIARRWT